MDEKEIIPLEKMGLELKRRERIISYLEEKAEDASSIVYDLAREAESEQVRLSAAKDILDRAGFKPVERSQNVTLEIDLRGKTNPELEEIRHKYEEELRNKFIQQIKDG